MGGEHAPGTHGLDRLVEAEPLGDVLTDPLQAEEPGMALVGVEHLGVQAERPQDPHPADAQHDLLADAVLGVPTVEPIGDVVAGLAVAVHVGVQEEQPDPSDVDLPGLDLHRVTGQVHGDGDTRRADGQAVRIELGEALLLQAVGVEPLAEVALVVEQPDADQRQAQVRGRLEMITGEHPEAAGVLRQGLGDPELGGEVGDQVQG